MANVGTINAKGETLEILGIAGTGDNAIVMELDNCERWNEFAIISTAGAMDVDVSLDGTNFAAAVALIDGTSATPATRVVVTAASRVYTFQGTVKAFRVRQNGATAVANSVCIASRVGRG